MKQYIIALEDEFGSVRSVTVIADSVCEAIAKIKTAPQEVIRSCCEV